MGSRRLLTAGLATIAASALVAGATAGPATAAPAAAGKATAARGTAGKGTAGEAAAGKATAGHGKKLFDRIATYPVFQNRPIGEDKATPTVAEISAITPDGRTVLYTDAAAKRIGFVDITDPRKPKGRGTLPVLRDGDAEAEPTSVAVAGRYALVVVNTSPSYTAPSGRLDIVRISDRKLIRSIDLQGQPDSIALDKAGRYAAIAIENERDEEFTPAGHEEGDLPQAPAGFLQIVDLKGSVDNWRTRRVDLDPKLLRRAGIHAPEDPEPEYVAIQGDTLAVTLQENNGIAFVDLPTGRVEAVHDLGTATVENIDTEDDGRIEQASSMRDVPREPDAVAWLDDRYVATANEGDLRGGTRGWSVIDSRTGTVEWDAGASFEKLAREHGLHDDSRSDNKGPEPEGIAVARYHGRTYAFVGSERSNFVAVYDVGNPTRPRLTQVLPTTNGPEGILPVPGRDLLVVSSEIDEPAANVRATVGIYELGSKAQFPTLVSGGIGWGALSGLSAVPHKNQLVAVTDSAYSPTRILTIDPAKHPATITRELVVRDAAGTNVGVDAEGVFARPQGGYWLATEGTASNGADNRLLRLDADGTVRQTVTLPPEILAGIRAQGLEGVTAITNRQGREQVWVAIQRGLTTDPAGVTRLGRYDVTTATWSWFGYELGSTTAANDWIGLSEVTVLGDRLAVIERDTLNGPDARIKRVYSVRLPATTPAAGTLPVLPKRLEIDVLPALRATNGWTQEKLEGLTAGGDGRLYAVTDNDGLDEATGETVFLRLGKGRR